VVINNIVAIVNIMSETTTIQITKKTRDKLRKIGKMGDDYNKVTNDLIIEHNINKLSENGEKFRLFVVLCVYPHNILIKSSAGLN
jgi:hypothetical protein